MARKLKADSPDFAEAFAALIAAKRDSDADVGAAVGAILDDVKARGDAAVIEYTSTYDRLDLTPATMAIGADEIAAARHAVDPETLQALRTAAERIEAYHRRLLPEDVSFTDETGVTLGARYRPLESVGIYVPGGRAAYPSSVLMNAVPAAGPRRGSDRSSGRPPPVASSMPAG